MRFLIISHAIHYKDNNKLFSYAPYVREMNVWLKYVDKVEIVAPFQNTKPTKIDLEYNYNEIKFSRIPKIDFITFLHSIVSLLVLPYILFKLFVACFRADHIHLRCPGNIGLLGCVVQLFFPRKTKTAKYAGNWDPKTIQPKSYRFQKWVLSNTFFTKNMNVLVYGNWKNQTKNIKSFFTASYLDDEKITFTTKDYSDELAFIFVGSLVEGKRPLFAIQLIGALQEKGISCKLDIFGDGVLKEKLQDYINENNVKHIVLHGNQTKETIKDYLLKSHFSILASKSEGWPKALAEAMFFGVIPIATKISCVPYMLDYGKRGILIEAKLLSDVNTIEMALKNKKGLIDIARNAQLWSQQYTLDTFEKEIKTLLH